MTPHVEIFAHGVGGSTDLPVPLSFALIGAAWALTATFAIVALAWKNPRFDPAKPGRDLPAWVSGAGGSPTTRWIIALTALLFALWVLAAAIWGPDGSDNALPGAFYVLLWVGLVALSVCVGPVWRLLSPARTVYRICGIVRRKGREASGRSYPPGWGY